MSPRGVEQARSVAQRLAGDNIVRIVASDFLRTRMTAEEIQRATGARISFDPLLQERNFGDLRGIPFKDIDFDIFMEGYAPPGGESWESFHARIDKAWARIVAVAEEAEGNIAVVTHALVCGSVASRHVVLPPGTTAPTKWENTAVTSIDRSPPFLVGQLNCARHLDDVGSGSLV